MRARRLDPNRYRDPGLLRSIFDQLRLTWRLLNDPRVPSSLKLLIPALVVLYTVSPVDVLPDFLLGIGQLDDLGVILAALALFARLAPRAVVDEHRAVVEGRPMSAQSHASEYNHEPVIDAEYHVNDRRRTAGP